MVRRVVAVAAVLAVFGAGDAQAEPSGSALVPSTVLELSLAGDVVPADAIAVVLNVTVTNPAQAGYVTAYSCSDDIPNVSNLNFVAGSDAAAASLVNLSPDGSVCVWASAVTDVIVDVQGYVPVGSAVVPLEVPVRSVDTRSGLGRLTAGGVVRVEAAAVPGVPADAAALVMTATAVHPDAAGYLTTFPCDTPTPPTSTLNFLVGRDVPNLAITATGPAGAACVTTDQATDVLVDVVAYIEADPSGLTLMPSPTRVIDTRSGLGTSAIPLGPGVRQLPLGAVSSAGAVVANITATRAASPGYVTLWPCGSAQPVVSNINMSGTNDVANAALLPVGDGGAVCATASTAVDLLIDVIGVLDTSDAITPIVSVRVADTRQDAAPQCGLGVTDPLRTQDQAFTVVDLRNPTAAPRQITSDRFNWSAPPTFEPKAIVDSTCKGLIVFNTHLTAGDPSAGPFQVNTEVLRVGFDGSVAVVGQWAARSGFVFPDGTIISGYNELMQVGSSGIVRVRLPNNDRVVQMLESGLMVVQVGIYEYQLFAPSDPGDPSYPDAIPLWTVPYLAKVNSTGLYSAVITPTGLEVQTAGGEIISVLDSAWLRGPDPSVHYNVSEVEWFAEGTMVVCGSTPSGMRSWIWSIHSTSPVLLPNTECLADAR